MTFPNPFDEQEIPGLADVDESLEKTGRLVTYLAEKLRSAAEQSLQETEKTLTRVKKGLFRPVTQSIADTGQGSVDRIGASLLNAVDNSLADTDARLMMVAPRLGARRDAAALGVSPSTPPPAPAAAPVVPGPVAPAGGTSLAPARLPSAPSLLPPAGGGDAVHGWDCPGPVITPGGEPGGPPGLGCVRPATILFDGRPTTCCPPGWQLRQFAGYDGFWCCRPGGGGGGPGGGGGGGGGGGPPDPSHCPPTPICPPAPICPPCPPAPPGPVLLGPPECQTGLPRVDAPQVVYLAPWLGAEAQGNPSVWSECGQKHIADAQGRQRPADRYARVLSTPGGWQSWQRDYEQDGEFIGEV